MLEVDHHPVSRMACAFKDSRGCRDDYLDDEYELYILRRAGDLAPMERERLSLIFKEAS